MADIIEELGIEATMLMISKEDERAKTINAAIDEIGRLRAALVGMGVGSRAAIDVLAERRRQITVELWTSEHDDCHAEGELADAAACYAAGCIPMAPVNGNSNQWVSLWPFTLTWWKPSVDRRPNLVKSGALILAEIERLDRAFATPVVNVGSAEGIAHHPV